MLAIIIVVWLISVNRLNTMFMELTTKQAKEAEQK
jgi:hypothetical protein